MKFVPMYELESLTESQKKDYYHAACEYLGLPPELGVLSYHWMDQNDGPKKLVLYAKKGATDIIRKNLGISVIDLKKEIGNGEVTWIAKGQNKEGRTEMSSGSKSTEGLKGRELESAVMWAQTKALRRMTLQFVGAGILDETEVETQNVPVLQAQATCLQPPEQPTAKPNPYAGITGDAALDFPKDARLVPTVAQAEAFKRRRHEPPTFDKPFVLSPAVDIPQSQQSPTPVPKQVNPVVPPQVESVVTTARIETIIKPIGKVMQAYKDKLYAYTNEMLPKAGMVPDENGGIAMKLRAFGAARYGVEELRYLSVDQWEDFFAYLDKTVQEKGAAELVKIIDTAVANV